MSKIIKHAVDGQPVTVGKKPVVREYKPAVFEQPEPSSKVSLDFNKRIDRAIGQWVGQIREFTMTAEDERKKETGEAIRNATEQAFENGRSQERDEREKYIDDHFSSRMAVIEQLLIRAKKQQQDSFLNLERKVIDLAIAIAETLINRSLDIEPDILEDIVRESMSYIINAEKMVLKVSTEDHQMISAKHDQWFSLAGNVKEFRIEADRRLNRGDCLVETEGGIIDASIKSRLATVAEELIRVPKP